MIALALDALYITLILAVLVAKAFMVGYAAHMIATWND